MFQFDISHLNLLLLLGIILFGGTLGGRLFQKIRIPQVVGYIIIGVVLGQSVLKVVNADMVDALQPLSYFALALIGFMIGGELKIKVFKKYGRQFIWILLLEALVAFVVVGVLTTVTLLLITHDVNRSIALGLLLGAISSATAPAATTDVLWENKTRGPVTSIVLGIVAMDDGIALILFALTSSIAGVLVGQNTQSLGLNLLSLVYDIGLSVILGFLFGFVLSRIIRRYRDDDKILAFSLGSILLLIGVATALDIDLILAAMSMGFFKTNFTPRSSQSTFKLVERFTPPIYVLFFVLVGAKMDFSALSPFVLIMAGVYLFGRTAGKYIGASLGARISGAVESVRKYLPFCLLSQAGVAIGLSIIAGQSFPGDVGNTIILIVTTTTFVVQLIGPPSVKYAVEKAGEVGLNVTEEDIMKTGSVSDVLPDNPPYFLEGTPASKVLEEFSRNDSFYFPVLRQAKEKKELLGIITIDSLKDTLSDLEMTQWLLALDLVEEVVCTGTDDKSLLEVREIMGNNYVEYLPIIDAGGDYKGIIEERLIQKYVSSRMLTAQKESERLG